MAEATSLFSSVLPDFTLEPHSVVAIYNEDYEPILETMKVLSIDVNDDSKLCQHPLEDGSIMTDHDVNLPIEIVLTIALDRPQYANVYAEIVQYKRDKTFLIIQSKVDSYPNQVLKTITHSESADMWNGVEMVLRFEQIILATAQNNVEPRNPTNVNTIEKGTLQGADANANQTGKATSGLFIP